MYTTQASSTNKDDEKSFITVLQQSLKRVERLGKQSENLPC